MNSITLTGTVSARGKVYESGSFYMIRFTLMTVEVMTTNKEIQWHNLVATNDLAREIWRDCDKGRGMVVSGRLTYRQVGFINNQPQYIPEICVEEFALLSSITVSEIQANDH